MSASQAVFDTVELVEMIFLQSPHNSDVLMAQTLNRSIKDIIKNSPNLQQKLFFQPVEFAMVLPEAAERGLTLLQALKEVLIPNPLFGSWFIPHISYQLQFDVDYPAGLPFSMNLTVCPIKGFRWGIFCPGLAEDEYYLGREMPEMEDYVVPHNNSSLDMYLTSPAYPSQLSVFFPMKADVSQLKPQPDGSANLVDGWKDEEASMHIGPATVGEVFKMAQKLVKHRPSVQDWQIALEGGSEGPRNKIKMQPSQVPGAETMAMENTMVEYRLTPSVYSPMPPWDRCV